jgi:hypothetical protein
LKPGQPLLSRALAALADFELAHERFAAAEPLYRRLIAQPPAGMSDQERLASASNLARLLRVTGRAAEAARIEASVTPVESRGSSHPAKR